MPSPHADFWNKTQLLDRGWTDAGIATFLGDPDELRKNKRRRNGPKIRLYRVERVQAAEESPDWISWRAKSEARRNAQRTRAEKSRKETLTMASAALTSLSLSVEHTGLTYEELKDRATTSFLAIEKRREDRSGGRYTAEQVTSRRSERFFHRIIVNWLRHEGTRYDSSLDEYFNMVGVNVAKDMVRERAYQLIAQEYPVLAEECQRQLTQRRATTLRRTGQDVTVQAR